MVPFAHYGNLTGTTSLLRSAGPTHVVHNTSADCTKGIDRLIMRGVYVICDATGSLDPKLSNWVAAPHGVFNMSETEPVVHRTPFYSQIYCFGHNITVADGSTAKCPWFVFKLPANMGFTVGGLHHSVHNIETCYLNL